MKNLPDSCQGLSLLQKTASLLSTAEAAKGNGRRTEIALSYQRKADATVLVVDDDVEVCQILQRMLSLEHYSVHISQSVAEANLAMQEERFDLYLLDYHLTDGTGLEVAQDIRSKGGQEPIILISGSDLAGVSGAAEALHVFPILPKPFSRAMITKAVRNAIDSPTTVLAVLAKAVA